MERSVSRFYLTVSLNFSGTSLKSLHFSRRSDKRTVDGISLMPLKSENIWPLSEVGIGEGKSNFSGVSVSSNERSCLISSEIGIISSAGFSTLCSDSETSGEPSISFFVSEFSFESFSGNFGSIVY